MKEPSLFSKLITIYYEQAKRRRALRLLQKQTWSFDFLSLLLVRAGKMAGSGLSLVIENKDGLKMTISYDKAKSSGVDKTMDPDDDIFNQLDNDAAVQDFIRRNSVR